MHPRKSERARKTPVNRRKDMGTKSERQQGKYLVELQELGFYEQWKSNDGLEHVSDII